MPYMTTLVHQEAVHSLPHCMKHDHPRFFPGHRPVDSPILCKIIQVFEGSVRGYGDGLGVISVGQKM